jgi:hypothetical protein
VEPVSFPLDEELELLPGELSATLAEGVARLGTKMPVRVQSRRLNVQRMILTDYRDAARFQVERSRPSLSPRPSG